MRLLSVIVLISPSFCLSQTSPLSQRQACSRFSDAVVAIDAGGQKVGTGFFVSPDGLILTAAHVVRDDTVGRYFQTITVTMPDGHLEFAQPAAEATIDSTGKDFALLRVPTAKPVSFLLLGSEDEAEIGAEATIIGFPFNAITANKGRSTPKFCLSAYFAAKETATYPVTWNATVPNSRDPAIRRSTQTDVHVNMIYFQSPAIKGISGSPIVSRDSGHVVGIVNLTLAGINEELFKLKQATEHTAVRALVAGIDPNASFDQIITVLGEQLANGLGAATGIDDPKEALREVQRKKR